MRGMTFIVALTIGVVAISAMLAQEGTQPAAVGGYDAAAQLRMDAHRAMGEGDPTRGIEDLAAAADLFVAAGAPADARTVWVEIADVLMGGAPDEAREVALEALGKMISAGEATSDDSMLARGLTARAQLSQQAGDPSGAASDLTLAAESASRLGSGLMLGTVVVRLSALTQAGADIPELAGYQVQAIDLLANSGSQVGGEMAVGLLGGLAHACLTRGDTQSAGKAALACARMALRLDEPWRAAETLEQMAWVSDRAAGGTEAVAFIETMLPEILALDDAATKAATLAALAQGEAATPAVIEAFLATLETLGNDTEPHVLARLLAVAASMSERTGDGSAADYRSRALAATLALEDVGERVDVAHGMCEPLIDSGKGDQAVELINAVRDSIPDTAPMARARLSLAGARIGMEAARRATEMAMEAAEMAGQEPGPMTYLDTARQQALQDLAEIGSTIDDIPDEQLEVGLLTELGSLQLELGDPLGAEATLASAIARGRESDEWWVLREALWTQAQVQHQLSRDDRAADMATEMLAIGNPAEASWMSAQAAHMLANGGRFDEAIEIYTSMASVPGEAEFAEEIRFFRAWAHLMAGSSDEARADLESVPVTDRPAGRLTSTLLARDRPEPMNGMEMAHGWPLDWLLRGPMNTVGEARRLAVLADAAVAGLRALEAEDLDLAGWLLVGAEALNLAGDNQAALDSLQGVPEVYAEVGMTELQSRALRAQATANTGLGNTDEAAALNRQAGDLQTN